MLVRKKVGNAADYFDKTYAEYKAGFAANGELKQQSNVLIFWDQFMISSPFRRELAWP